MNSKIAFVSKVSIIVALGGFLMGFDASVISGVVKFIEPHFELSKIQLGWAVGCLTLTATLAMMLAGPLSDKFGRKKILKYAAILYAVSAILSALAPSFLWLVIARMIGGLGVGASLIIAPMYIAELAPPKVRGTMVSFNQLNIVIGISVAFFTNYLILQWGKSDAPIAIALKLNEYNWRWMLGLETLPAILYYIFLFMVPESPRWLVMNGEESKGKDIMLRANEEAVVNEDIKAIKESLAKDQKKERVPLKELFKPAMKLVMLIGIVIAITQQITGINAVFFYAPMIFEQTGIGTDASFSQAILVGLTNLVFTVLAMWLIDKVGRKILLVVGLSGILVSMSFLAYGFGSATYQLAENVMSELAVSIPQVEWTSLGTKTYYSDLEFIEMLQVNIDPEILIEQQSNIVAQAITINPWLVLIGVMGFVASFAVSLGPVMWVLFSELFPNRLRGLAISFAGFINSGVSFMVQLVFPWELANIGSSTTFLIYGIFGAIGLIVIAVYLPETKGKSLEELEKILVK